MEEYKTVDKRAIEATTQAVPTMYFNNDVTELALGDEFEVKFEGEGTYVVRKKGYMPKTYEECEKKAGVIFDFQRQEYKGEVITILQELLICRDVYWRLADNWEPDWEDSFKKKYTISRLGNDIGKFEELESPAILAFPTEEMRDAFYENFKKLIEQCKELL